MIHSRLSNKELERLVYVEPGNAAASAELLSRVPDLIANNDEDLVDAQTEVKRMERLIGRQEVELDEIESERDSAIKAREQIEERLAIKDMKISALEEKIADLELVS